MTAAFVSAALLALVAYNLRVAGGLGGRIARALTPDGERRNTVAWAAGTWATYGLTALAALILLGRADALVVIPPSMGAAARRIGLAAATAPGELARLAGYLLVGVAAGVAVRAILTRLGWRYRGYRSPATVERRGDVAPALALALAAGVGEELFFRLALPLAVALATGSGWAGIAVGYVAFVALHAYQGRLGAALVAGVAAVLTYLYLATGSLLLVAGVHVAVDVAALVFPPRRVRT